ncbi:MAG: Gfo/Idh/MocA family oxidoreductase [Caldilineaceae bacterium]
MLQIAVIGLGWAGTRQIKAIHELGKMLEVAAIVDNDPEQLQQAQVGATAKQ